MSEESNPFKTQGSSEGSGLFSASVPSLEDVNANVSVSASSWNDVSVGAVVDGHEVQVDTSASEIINTAETVNTIAASTGASSSSLFSSSSSSTGTTSTPGTFAGTTLFSNSNGSQSPIRDRSMSASGVYNNKNNNMGSSSGGFNGDPMFNSFIEYPDNDIIVNDPQQSGDFGLTSYMTYRVYTESKKTEVRRRFNDFAWLQQTLYCLYPGILIPPIPSKENKLFVEHKDDTFVNMRMRAFQRFLNRVNSHPTLRESADFQTFLCGPEKAFEAKKKVSVKSPLDTEGFGAGFSISGFFGNDTTSVSMETNKEKEKAKNYLIGLEAKLNVLGLTARKMINLKSAYCTELDNLEAAMKELANGEPEHIKQPLELLSESMPEQKLFLEAEVKTEIEGFYELIVDWGRMVHASQELIDSQDLAAKKVAQANKSLKQARDKQVKMSSNASQHGKISAAEEAVTQATQDVDVANDTLKHIKESMEEELLRFQQHKSFDFRDMLVKYCNSNLIYHEQMAAKWRELFPAVDELSIPETG